MKDWIIKRIEEYQANTSLHQTKKCRFVPSCSEYAKESFKRFNIFYASFLSIKRILKCNPLHKMCYDPVPEKKEYRHKFKTLEETFEDIRINKYFTK